MRVIAAVPSTGVHAPLRDLERDLLQRRELAEVHLAGLDPEHVRALPADRPERGHDGCGRGEELVAVQAQPVGGGAEHVLQPLGGIAVAVERAAELEHEADGRRDRARRGGARRDSWMVGHLGSGWGR